MDRRAFNAVAGLALAGWAGGVGARGFDSLAARCRALEGELGARLGVAVLDTGSGRLAGYRSGERFPMCSTFKWIAAAHVLSRVDAGVERIDRRIRYAADVLIEHSPVTREHVGGGMTLGELCEATITISDNAAANLILETYGGPAGLTRYVRSIGDALTRFDRTEPALNISRPGDERDTTTPAAMAATLRRVLLGDALSRASRERLTRWMLATKTSDRRLRAHLPDGWRLADKTGSAKGTANDVGMLWPPAGDPIAVAVYLTGSRAPAERNDAAIAEVGRWVVEGA